MIPSQMPLKKVFLLFFLLLNKKKIPFLSFHLKSFLFFSFVSIQLGFLEIHFIKNQSRDRSKKKRKKFWCVLDTTRVLYLFLSPKNEAGVPVASFYFGDTVIIEVTSCNPKLTKFQIVDSLPPVAKRTPSPSPAPSFPPRSPPERPRTPPHSLEPFAPVPNPQGWVLRCHSSYTDFVSWRDTIKALSKVHIIDTEVGFAGSGGSNSRRRGGSAKGGGSVGRGSGKSSPGGSVRVGGSIGRKGGSLKKGSVGRKGGGVLKDSGRLDSGGKREDGPGFSKRVATVMEAGIGGVWWSGGEKGNWEGPEDGYVFMLVGDDVSRREFGILCQKMKGYCKRTRSSDEHQVIFFFFFFFFIIFTFFFSLLFFFSFFSLLFFFFLFFFFFSFLVNSLPLKSIRLVFFWTQMAKKQFV